MIRNIFTIGYSGYDIDEFVAALARHEVRSLIDTRELPISRKAGFSKTKLRETLEENEIAYAHFRQLGSPRSARKAVRATRDYNKFFRSVRTHLSSEDGRMAIAQVGREARSQSTCLMCCCSDWSLCHRSIITEIISRQFCCEAFHIQRGMPQKLPRRAA